MDRQMEATTISPLLFLKKLGDNNLFLIENILLQRRDICPHKDNIIANTFL